MPAAALPVAVVNAGVEQVCALTIARGGLVRHPHHAPRMCQAGGRQVCHRMVRRYLNRTELVIAPSLRR